MKKIIQVFIYLIAFVSFGQNIIEDVIIDGKPAKLNTTTGVYTFTEGAPSNYKESKPLDNSIKTTANNTEVETVAEVFNGDIHTVSKGETLYAISKKYGISIAHIKSLNKLKSNIISINQKLKIGYSQSAEIKETLKAYKIKKGDTLFSIAKQYNLTVQELKALNNLESNAISIGQVLNVK